MIAKQMYSEKSRAAVYIFYQFRCSCDSRNWRRCRTQILEEEKWNSAHLLPATSSILQRIPSLKLQLLPQDIASSIRVAKVIAAQMRQNGGDSGPNWLITASKADLLATSSLFDIGCSGGGVLRTSVLGIEFVAARLADGQVGI